MPFLYYVYKNATVVDGQVIGGELVETLVPPTQAIIPMFRWAHATYYRMQVKHGEDIVMMRKFAIEIPEEDVDETPEGAIEDDLLAADEEGDLL